MSEQYPLALPEKSVLAGQYIIDRVLGEGGFGITYCAKDHKTGLNVAIKEFFPDSMATRKNASVIPFTGDAKDNFEYGKECFLQEAQTLSQFIGNNNIVQVHSYFEENGTAYFVMDYVEGISFDTYIRNKGGKLSFDETLKILSPVMAALSLVHSRGIIHRDVTPDNIFITNDGAVKLLDFGAARYSLGDKSQSLDIVLKHGFAPKEQYVRHGKQGPFTDVYSMGATFYYALTGECPPDSIERMESDTIITLSKKGVVLPKEAEDAILIALRVQPADRFQNMQAFNSALSHQSDDAVYPSIQKFFSAPMNETAQNDGVERPIQDLSDNVNLDSINDFLIILKQSISKISYFIDSHIQQSKYAVFAMFCMVVIFHLLASKWGVDTRITVNGEKEFSYVFLIMSVPLMITNALIAYFILNGDVKILRWSYFLGLAGYGLFILFICIVDDLFFSDPLFFLKNSYYGDIFIITGILIYALGIARLKKHRFPVAVWVILCSIQSLGLFIHSQEGDRLPTFFFSTANAAAYIMLAVLLDKSEKKSIYEEG